MTIQITEFADANISISPSGVGLGNFGILGFLTKETGIPATERGRSYQSLSEVTNDWATSSEVYKAAASFYAQTPKPLDFVVLSNYNTAQPAILTGGSSSTVAQLAAITNGTLTIATVADGATDYTVDFTGITSYSDAATTLTTAISSSGQVVTHNGYSFVLSTSATGESATMSFPTGDLADDLGFAPHQGALVQGSDAETLVQSLAEAVNMNIKFTAFCLHKDFRDEDGNATTGMNIVDVADWAEASSKIFMNTTNNLATLSAQVTTDIGSKLLLKSLRFTETRFSKNPHQYPCANIFGRAASVNFEGVGTTITLNLKQAPTITAEDLTSSELKALQGKRVNVIIQIGDDAIGYTSSIMSNGSWLDTTHGLLWLENRIEVDMFNLLYRTNTKIPYTQVGINLTAGVLERSLAAGVRNGLLASGYLPDGRYLTDGYEIHISPLADVPSSDKTDRVYRGLSFEAVGAGALHKVKITGEFSE